MKKVLSILALLLCALLLLSACADITSPDASDTADSEQSESAAESDSEGESESNKGGEENNGEQEPQTKIIKIFSAQQLLSIVELSKAENYGETSRNTIYQLQADIIGWNLLPLFK